MKNKSKNNIDGLKQMKKKTRDFFYDTFRQPNQKIDKQAAAEFFGVTPRTITNWWSTGCPDWVDSHVALYLRAIPNSTEWNGFRFSHDGKELLTPYEKHSFTPQTLLMDFYNRQFNRNTRTEHRQLTKQVDSLRNDEEAAAIRAELDGIISAINKLKHSPIVAPKNSYSKTIKDK
ncbi:hypothetical protein [Shewanella sp. TB7-MNA-CIBAN-0143]|uniref:hypothetical protein n=1 Tax=Shewanella sp. TB7-MNA-CIBAN-0143 TaxID=3140465 RepID=UPI00332406F6